MTVFLWVFSLLTVLCLHLPSVQCGRWAIRCHLVLGAAPTFVTCSTSCQEGYVRFRTHMCTYAHMHEREHLHTHIYTHIHLHRHMCIHMYMQTYTYMHAHTYMHTHVHMHTYVCTYTYTGFVLEVTKDELLCLIHLHKSNAHVIASYLLR